MRAFTLISLLILSLRLGAQLPQPSLPGIVNKKHPLDSSGETVYSFRGKDDGESIVAGMLVPPKVVKAGSPEFTKALKKKKVHQDVKVSITVSATGIPIDLESNQEADPDAAAAAVEAVRHYRFQPATLDGKPVAIAIVISVHFNVF